MSQDRIEFPHRTNKPLTNSNSQPKVTKRGLDFAGRHLIASYTGCDQTVLQNSTLLMNAMAEAIQAAGAQLIKCSEHMFPTSGMTAVFLLSESHASIHTYPEHNSCFVDIFTCSSGCNPEVFDRILRQHLRPAQADVKILHRSKDGGEIPGAIHNSDEDGGHPDRVDFLLAHSPH